MELLKRAVLVGVLMGSLGIGLSGCGSDSSSAADTTDNQTVAEDKFSVKTVEIK